MSNEQPRIKEATEYSLKKIEQMTEYKDRLDLVKSCLLLCETIGELSKAWRSNFEVSYSAYMSEDDLKNYFLYLKDITEGFLRKNCDLVILIDDLLLKKKEETTKNNSGLNVV